MAGTKVGRSAPNATFNSTISSRKPKSHCSLPPKQLQLLAKTALRIFPFHFLFPLLAGFLVIINGHGQMNSENSSEGTECPSPWIAYSQGQDNILLQGQSLGSGSRRRLELSDSRL